MRYTARCPRRPVNAGLTTPEYGRPGFPWPADPRAGKNKIEVTMKRTQPNARKLTAVSVNAERLCRLRSARIARPGCKVVRLFWG